MFENVTWEMAVQVSLCVGIGLVLRTFVPYFRVAYELIKETNKWKLPRFEPKYILPPAATLGAYVFGILTNEGALLVLSKLHPTALILAAFFGQDLFRKTIKALLGK